jgi:hypothetical protein
MRYRIIEETDGVGMSTFYAQVEVKGIFRLKWKDVRKIDVMKMSQYGIYSYTREFDSATEALHFVKKHYAPKTRIFVEEGEL